MNCGKKVTKVFSAEPNGEYSYNFIPEVFVKDGLIRIESKTIFVIRTADLISMIAEK